MAKRNKHPEDIKAAVRKTGISLAELARRNGISDSSARKALYLPRPGGNRVIAEYLKKPVHDIWPEWFDKHGNRISLARKDTCGPVVKASQKAAVA